MNICSFVNGLFAFLKTFVRILFALENTICYDTIS